MVEYVGSGPAMVAPSGTLKSLSSMLPMPVSSGGLPLPSRWWQPKQELSVKPGRATLARAIFVNALPVVKIGLVAGTTPIGSTIEPGAEPRGQSNVVGGL